MLKILMWNWKILAFRNNGVKIRPGLVILRRSKMPAVLVESGFINSEEDNRLFDEEFDRIADGIADAILKNFSLTDEEETEQEETYYRVQTGAYRNRENAVRQQGKAHGRGISSISFGTGRVLSGSGRSFFEN